eukprot:6063930-Ditylum_brightwellii.AAC.1
MNHSCSPNTRQSYVSSVEYESYAQKVIAPGDQITCDYTKLDNNVTKMENIGTTSFRCNCGERNCIGYLVC